MNVICNVVYTVYNPFIYEEEIPKTIIWDPSTVAVGETIYSMLWKGYTSVTLFAAEGKNPVGSSPLMLSGNNSSEMIPVDGLWQQKQCTKCSSGKVSNCYVMKSEISVCLHIWPLLSVLCLCRCVPDSQRSFGLGIQWIVVRTLGRQTGFFFSQSLLLTSQSPIVNSLI